MKRNEICYVAIVVIIGASLLLGFAEEVFHTDLGGLKWAAHWVSSPVALAIGFAFALLLGKALPAFNKTMSKKLLQYSVSPATCSVQALPSVVVRPLPPSALSSRPRRRA